MAKVFPANRALALEKIKEGNVLSVARDGNRYFIEYNSTSGSQPDVIIFEKDGDDISAWHECPAYKNNYSRGCWHLGLAGWLYKLPDGTFEINIITAPDQLWAREDLTPAFLDHSGKFKLLQLDPDAPEQPEEENFLGRFRLPKTLLEKVLQFRERQINRLTDEQKSRIPQNVKYIPQKRELVYAVAALLYDTWAPPLFMGPAGSGKSTLAEAVAEILYLPLRKISGGIDVNAEYLLGSKTLAPIEAASDVLTAKVAFAVAKSGSPLTSEETQVVSQKLSTSTMQVIHEPGVLLQAVTDGEMILVDEINMLIPEVTSLLHSLLDWQKCITVPGVGEVKAHEDFRLVAAMNVGYMGTRPLNKAFRDRFRGIQVEGISKNTLISLLEDKAGAAAEKLADIYESIYEAVYSPVGATMSESCLSLRALLRAAEEYSLDLGPLNEITISCLTESLESDSERTQVKDIIDMNF